jgi:Uncharacterized protein SCO1/SenC/PrrC, involved in biogenesis of respiratory and photosynthetic systems
LDRARAASGWVCAALLSVLGLPTASVAAERDAANLYELAFDWQDDHGEATRLAQWQGQTIMLTMANSTCRKICTYTLHRLEQLQKSAERAGTRVDVVVISYDPSVDSPATWSIYRRHHHLARADWHFLTGNAATTKQFATALNFPYWFMDDHVVHDFQILLVGPGGQIARTLTWANRNEELFTAAAPICRPSDSRSCKS